MAENSLLPESLLPEIDPTSQPIVLFDSDQRHDDLLPLSFTRPLAEFRVGILTIREKWEWLAHRAAFSLPPQYMRLKFPLSPFTEAFFVASWIIPNPDFAAEILALRPGQALASGDELIAFRGTLANFLPLLEAPNLPPVVTQVSAHADRLTFVFDIFRLNGKAITDDYQMLVEGRKSIPLPTSNTLIGDYVMPSGLPAVFIEEGASVEGAFINVKNGPVFIARDAEVMEGACLRGPISLGSHSKINMGAKIYGATTIGPWCKVGGEVNNAVFFGYSNKAHDGFIGNAVIGQWCNIGAGTNASNLKNDYSKIRIWNYSRKTFMRTDLQFCGLIMGDHSKIGVNCMINTATVIGVGVNIHGSGFPRPFIPSFSQGAPAAGFTDVPLSKFYDIASRVMSRRGLELTEADKQIFERVYQVASSLKK